MWSLFRRDDSCPITAEQKDWADRRSAWIREQFGEQLSKVNLVPPTSQFFPDPFDGQPEDLVPLMARVCGYLGVDPDIFDLYLYSEGDVNNPLLIDRHGMRPGTAGLYHTGATDGTRDDGTPRRPSLGIEVSQLHDPPALVATLAHEVSHELLIGRGRLTGDEPDHEPLTDLLTVWMGFGIITANATVREKSWSAGNVAGWRIARLGYMSQQTLAYALALFAKSRHEDKPAWTKHLRPDLRALTSQALRFVIKSDESRESAWAKEASGRRMLVSGTTGLYVAVTKRGHFSFCPSLY